MEKIEQEINDKLDIPNITDEEEGYLIHLIVSLIITLIYFAIRIYV